MQESEVRFGLSSNGNSHEVYRALIEALQSRGYVVELHDPNGHWPDRITTADGERAGRIESPFAIVAEIHQPGGEQLRNFLGIYRPENDERH